MLKPHGLSYSEIRNAILEKIPSEVGISRIEFEGPRLAIYTKKPEILQEDNQIVGELAGIIKKRIVIRSDPSVRMPELQSEVIIKNLLNEAGLVQAYFDPALGEVVLEVENPGVAIGRDGDNILEIVKQTHWSPNFVRSPPIPSMTSSIWPNSIGCLLMKRYSVCFFSRIILLTSFLSNSNLPSKAE